MFGSFLDIFHWVLSHFWKFGSPSVFKKQFIQKKIHHLRWFPLLTWRNISLNHQKTWVSRWPSPFFQLFFPHFPHDFHILEIPGDLRGRSQLRRRGVEQLRVGRALGAGPAAGVQCRPGWPSGCGAKTWLVRWIYNQLVSIYYIYDDGIYNWLVVLNGGRWYK